MTPLGLLNKCRVAKLCIWLVLESAAMVLLPSAEQVSAAPIENVLCIRSDGSITFRGNTVSIEGIPAALDKAGLEKTSFLLIRSSSDVSYTQTKLVLDAIAKRVANVAFEVDDDSGTEVVKRPESDSDDGGGIEAARKTAHALPASALSLTAEMKRSREERALLVETGYLVCLRFKNDLPEHVVVQGTWGDCTGELSVIGAEQVDFGGLQLVDVPPKNEKKPNPPAAQRKAKPVPLTSWLMSQFASKSKEFPKRLVYYAMPGEEFELKIALSRISGDPKAARTALPAGVYRLFLDLYSEDEVKRKGGSGLGPSPLLEYLVFVEERTAVKVTNQ